MAETFEYLGPFDEVEIARTGQVVERGGQVVIEDPEVAAGLQGQGAWKHITPPAKKATAKKSAAKAAEED